jgi:hypothetical protein
LRDDVFVDSEMFLMIDFVNLKIKPIQFFRDVHTDKMCVHVFIKLSDHTCINICPVLKKNIKKILRTVVLVQWIR